MKKILMVLTNIDEYPTTKEKTGLWLGEATEFIDVLNNQAIEIDYVSPKGGKVPIDPRSLKYADNKSLQMLNTNNSFSQSLKKSLNIMQVDYEKYDAIYFTGGHGVMWDFFNNKDINTITMNIYNKGGYIISVCHGIVALLELKKDNQFLIKNKKITGFTNTEELLSGKKRKVPFLSQTLAQQRGAIFLKKRFFKSNVIIDGKIITGQNPYSVRELALKVKKILIDK